MLAIEQAARGFAAAGSVPRLSVLRALVRTGPAGLTVGDLQDRLDIPASTLSHHLRHLVECGLIDQKRQGRQIINCANFPKIRKLADYLLSECCADSPQDGSSSCP